MTIGSHGVLWLGTQPRMIDRYTEHHEKSSKGVLPKNLRLETHPQAEMVRIHCISMYFSLLIYSTEFKCNIR